VDGELVDAGFTLALAYSKAINILHNGLEAVFFIPNFSDFTKMRIFWG
jgi:hypothetical protein